MNNIMVDIETLGTRPGSVVLSIGAVYFGREGLGEDFYCVISTEDSATYGLTLDLPTVIWWGKQSAGARTVLDEATSTAALPLRAALTAFSSFVSPDSLVWGNGAGFDNVLIEALYEKAKMPVPWKFYNSRCYRTLKELFPQFKAEGRVVAHNALQDAKDQAEVAVKILSHVYGGGKV